MPRKTHYVDLPVLPNTRKHVKKLKGKKTYDQFINDILDTELGF